MAPPRGPIRLSDDEIERLLGSDLIVERREPSFSGGTTEARPPEEVAATLAGLGDDAAAIARAQELTRATRFHLSASGVRILQHTVNLAQRTRSEEGTVGCETEVILNLHGDGPAAAPRTPLDRPAVWLRVLLELPAQLAAHSTAMRFVRCSVAGDSIHLGNGVTSDPHTVRREQPLLLEIPIIVDAGGEGTIVCRLDRPVIDADQARWRGPIILEQRETTAPPPPCY